MRKRVPGDVTVNAISGTHVVLFGLDLAEAQRPGFHGFAIKRFDHKEGDTVWLRGMKAFEKTEPHPARDATFSTRDQPMTNPSNPSSGLTTAPSRAMTTPIRS